MPVAQVTGQLDTESYNMATKNLWGITQQPRNIVRGWTASSIAHNQDLQSAAHKALSPNPAQQQILNQLTGKVLGATNFKMGTSVPAGAITGSAQVLGSGGIPAAVQSAIGNMQTNVNTGATADLLQKFLQLIGSNKPTQVQTGAYPESMDTYYQHKNVIMEEPANIQTNINKLRTAADKLQPSGVMSITPGVPGSYEGSVSQDIDRQLAKQYVAQTEAKKAAYTTGWLPYMPNY